MATSDDNSPITFAVPGQSGPVPPQPLAPALAQTLAQTVARGTGGASTAATPAPLPGTVKASVRVGTQRDGGAPVRVTAVPGEDIVALHIEDGPVLLLHPATARDLLQGPMPAQRGVGDGTVHVQVEMHWPGADASFSNGLTGNMNGADAATRGLADIGRVVVSGFQVLTSVFKGPAVKWASSQVVQRVDGQVDAGVYALQPNRMDKLKGSGSKVAQIPASKTPILVLVHGTFVETTSTFEKLWAGHRASVDKLFAHYANQVYALDHPTLGASPVANARTLVDALPSGARLHLVTHSRGGLVAEVLARVAGQRGVIGADDLAFFSDPAYASQAQELRELADLVRAKNVQVERVVRVACPARGTLLASKRLDAYLSVLKWTLEATGMPVVPAFVDFIGEVARTRADPAQIPGLAAMIPGTPLVDWLNAAPDAIPGDLRVVAGDLQHGTTLGSWLKALLADAYYWTDNDIVVHTSSMYGGAPRAGGATFLLDQSPNATHFSYFINDLTADGICSALMEDKPPAGFKPIGPMSWAGESSDGVRGQGVSAVGLPLGQATRSAPDGSKPAVFILPGILGSNLKQGDGDKAARIWLSPRLIGGFDRLAYLPNGTDLVADDGPIGLVYDKLVAYLSQTHEVIPFGYDWRRPLQEEASRLAKRVNAALDQRKDSKQPVRVLAHSMGGLLARTLQIAEPATWKRLMAHADARLVMLGTPNAGSWAPMQVLSGDDTFGNALAAIGSPFANRKARGLMAQMPGFIQLQAGLLDAERKLDQEATWQKLADDDYKYELQRNWWQRYAGDTQTAAYQWGVPPQAVLTQAKALRTLLDAQLTGALKTDAAKLRLVVGRAKFTPDGFEVGTDGFVYLDAVDGGDGRVPLESALLPGVQTWTLDCEHGALPSTQAAFDAYLDLLVGGSTIKLALLGAAGSAATGSRAGTGMAGMQGVPHVRSRPARHAPSALPAGSIGQIFGGGTPEPGTPGSAPMVPPLQITVLNGNLTFVQQPLLLGHYSALQLTGTEAVVDGHLGGAMRTALQAGIYPEAPGSHRVFFNSQGDDANPWQLPRPQAAIVVGLGAEGSLSSAQLEFSVAQGVKAWAQRAAEEAAGRAAASPGASGPGASAGAGAIATAGTSMLAPDGDSADSRDRADRSALSGMPGGPPGIELAATLIGSGGIGISAGESARAIARGVRQANERMVGSNWPLVTRLTIVEWYLDRAGDAWRGLRVLGIASPGVYDLAPAIASGTGPLRRQPDSGYRGADYDLISASTSGDGTISFALDTRRARTEVRAQRTQATLLRKLVERAATAASSDPQLGNTLFQLLVPLELTPFLSGTDRVLLQLDAGTAPIPWELLDTRPENNGSGNGGATSGELPWAIRTKLLRKLATSDFRAAPRDATADAAVLVIGEPLTANPQDDRPAAQRPSFPRLPGARAEAIAVAAQFTGPNGIGDSRVTALTDSAPFDAVIGALMARPYRVVHIAGHGMPLSVDPTDKTKVLSDGGVVLSEGVFLGPNEIKSLAVVPELVFLNCCHLAEHAAEQTLSVQQPVAFAAAVADALIQIGVRCVVAAGWAVDDRPAELFAQTFYRTLLQGRPFVEAVAQARMAARSSAPNSKTWAAYQCYGDPDWVFHDRPRDAQTPSSARHDFEVIVSAAGLALALENLAVKARYFTSKDAIDRARMQQATQARLRDMAERYAENWAGMGAVAEAFAVAWDASGDPVEAISWYQRALQANDASASLKAQEQLCNLRVRGAWEAAKDAAPGSPLLATARAEINSALGGLQALNTMQPTIERLSLCGSAFKRLAQVEERASGATALAANAKRRSKGGGNASNNASKKAKNNASTAALSQAFKAYQAAEDMAIDTRHPDLFYPALNRMALELAMHSGNAQWPGFDAAASARLHLYLQARHAAQPDFWSNVALIEFDLYEALAQGTLQDAKVAQRLIDGYADLHARVQARSSWESVANQLRFAVGAPRQPSAPAARSVAQALQQQLDGYAAKPPGTA